MIDNATKVTIKEHLTKYCENAGSDNKAATALSISNAYISHIKRDNWAPISDDMWRKLSAALGIKFDESWRHADTVSYKTLTNIFEDAQHHANVYGIVCSPGSGKTYTLDAYKRSHRNVFVVKCQRHTTERDFLRQILQGMGVTHPIFTITGLLTTVLDRISRLDAPLIIIDEYEKVKNDVMFLFVDIYNELHNKAGIVMVGTPNLRTRIERGVQRGKMCFNEILSRLGGKLIDLPAPTSKDGAAVIRANGIDDTLSIQSIVNESLDDNNKVDLRRVERLVHKEKLMEGAAA